MLDRANTNSTERLTQLVRQLLARRSINQSVGYDDVLSERGLSSLDTVNLMLAVETEFDRFIGGTFAVEIIDKGDGHFLRHWLSLTLSS